MAVLLTPGSLALSRALSCAEGAGMCLCVSMCKCMHECVKERPLATLAQVHMLGFSVARRAPGHFRSHRHTHTQSTCCFLYGNQSCQLPDRLMLRYDWLICSDVGVSQHWLQSHWWSGSNDYASLRHIWKGGSDRKKNDMNYMWEHMSDCMWCVHGIVCVCVCKKVCVKES